MGKNHFYFFMILLNFASITPVFSAEHVNVPFVLFKKLNISSEKLSSREFIRRCLPLWYAASKIKTQQDQLFPEKNKKRIPGVRSQTDIQDAGFAGTSNFYLAPSILNFPVEDKEDHQLKVLLIRELSKLRPPLHPAMMGYRFNLSGIHKRITWKISKHLKSGGFGNVYEIRFRVPGASQDISIALKQIRKASGRFVPEREIFMLNLFNGHPRFIRYYGAFVGHYGEAILALEKMDGDISSSTIQYSDQMFLDLTDGLSALRQFNIFHGDIKPENILVKNNRFYIGDLGGASYAIPGFTHPQVSRTIVTNAPEFSLFHQDYGQRQCQINKKTELLDPFSADIFSTGVTLIEKRYPKLGLMVADMVKIYGNKPVKYIEYQKVLLQQFYEKLIDRDDYSELDFLLFRMTAQSPDSRIPLKILQKKLNILATLD